MAFSATFLFLSLLMVSAMVTNSHLKKIELKTIKQVTRVEEGEEIPVTVRLVSPSFRPGLRLRLLDRDGSVWWLGPELTLTGGEAESFQFFCPPRKRGLYSLRELYLETDYPVGLFRAWSPAHSPYEIGVLPRPVDFGKRPLSKGRQDQDFQETKVQIVEEGEEFFDHRPYQPSDSWRHLDWKVFARRDMTFKKRYSNQVFEGSVVFHDQELYDLNFEERLSQLYFWVKQAVQMQQSFELSLQGSLFEWVPGRSLEQIESALVQASELR